MNTFEYAFMTEFPVGWLANTDFFKPAHFRIWNRETKFEQFINEPFKSEYMVTLYSKTN